MSTSTAERKVESKLRILHLEVEHVKRVQAVEIDPAGDVVVLSGDNGEGKSSVLDAIEMALGGRSREVEVPIRQGHAEARVLIVLGDDGEPRFKVTKEFRRGASSRLKVEAVDGARVAGPQELLDSFLGDLAFDPASFADPPGEKTDAGRARIQRELLLRACPVGIDLAANAAERRRHFEARTAEGRTLRAREAELDIVTVPADPGPPIDEAPIRARLAELAKTNREVLNARSRLSAIEGLRLRNRTRIEELRRELARIEAEDAALATEREAIAFTAARELEDQADIMAELDAARARQAAIADRARRLEQRERARKLVAVSRDEVERLTAAIEACDRARADALAAVKFPIDGLSVDEAGVTLHGLPFAQASTAQRLEVSLAVAAALNPRLRVILVRDGNALDGKAMERVRGFAAERGYQVWIERVARDQAACVVIEDGRVATAAAAS